MDLFIDHIVLEHNNGMPIELISDRDTIFTSKFFKSMCSRMGTSLRLSTARSQATNGKAERKIAVIEEVMRMNVNYRQDNWLEALPFALFALNSAPVEALLGRSAIFYERGVQPLVPIDLAKSLSTPGKRRHDEAPTTVLERLDYLEKLRSATYDRINEAVHKSALYADERRRVANKLKVGKLARLNLKGIELNKFKHRGSKFNPIWYGPFKIIDQPSPNSFTLELPTDCYIHPTFHVSKLKPASDESFSKLKKVVLPTDSSTDGIYELEKILDHSYDGRTKTYSYYCKWKGYNELFHSTWEPEANVKSASRILREYKAKHIEDDAPEGGSSRKKQKKSH